jgi:hypothetical protein
VGAFAAAIGSAQAEEPIGAQWGPAARAARKKMELRLSRLIKRGVVADVALKKPGENGDDYDIVVSVNHLHDMDRVRKAARGSIAGFPVVVNTIDDTTQGLILNR